MFLSDAWTTSSYCVAAKDEYLLCWCLDTPCAIAVDGIHSRPMVGNPAEFADALPVEETALLLGSYWEAVVVERLAELPPALKRLAAALRGKL